MNKKDMIIRGGSVVLVIILLILWGRAGTKAPIESTIVVEESNTTESVSNEAPSYPIDVLNATYMIDDRAITLIDGTSSMPAAIDSETVMKVSLLNGPAFADIDGDGVKDAVVILRDEPGGTGVFYFASVLLSGNQKSTNSILLGDRIRIQSIEILSGGNVTIQTLEREITDPMTTAPSVLKTRLFRVENGTLTEVK